MQAISIVVDERTEIRAAQSALALSRKELVQLAQAMPQLVFMADATGEIEYYSSRRRRALGLDDSGITGEWRDGLHPDDLERVVAVWKEAIATGEPFEVENRVLHPDGRYYWYLTSAVPARDEAGNVVRWYGTATLIQKQKDMQARLEQTQQRLEMAQEAAGAGFWDWDLTTNASSWASRTYSIFGSPQGQPVHYEGWAAYVHPDDRERIEQSIRQSWDSQTDWHDEFRYNHPESGLIWVAGYGRTTYDDDGHPLRMTGLNQDVTWRRHAEEEQERLLLVLAEDQRTLRQFAETLEERVRKRTEQVRTLATELTLAEQQERRRLAQVMHDEVQQMLVYLQMQLASLARKTPPENVPERLREVEEIALQTLELTRAITSDLGVGPHFAGEKLADSPRWLAFNMEERYGLRVHLDVPDRRLTEDADLRMLLVRLVQELLFNVVKHAGVQEATIAVASPDGQVEIVVSDQGAGFDPGAVISQPSARTGFGMTSIRERLELFGGSMQIAAAPGAGSRFTLRVPSTIERAGSH